MELHHFSSSHKSVKVIFAQALRWCTAEEGWASVGAGHEDDPGAGFRDHLRTLADAMQGRADPPLGRPPEDLLQVLAEFALAGPGVCSLRALSRVTGDMALDDLSILNAAARIAGGFRTLFNLPESIALLRGGTEEESYWQLVLDYCLAGNLQSLLDEQVHVLKESLGLVDSDCETRVAKIGEALADALSIRTAPLRVDEIHVQPRNQRIDFHHFTLRCRFALRFAELRDDKNSTVARAETVREAFNSPFRPFILASTSIGQEGLDFHTWCHAVVHWNLPSNPVDLEQREGRVHRYKGHAVRKNIARRYGLTTLRSSWDGEGDPWHHLFEFARSERPSGASDLVPYWVFEIPDGACVERRVPMLPFSKEVERLEWLKRSLAVYRLVFGQPRQEDLLTYLTEKMTQAELETAIAGCRISLAPTACLTDDDLCQPTSPEVAGPISNESVLLP